MTLDLRGIVAGNVRAQRARLDLRQQDLADRAGFSRATYADLERGERRVTLEDLVVLCEALEVGLLDLIQGREPEAVRCRRALAGPDVERLAQESAAEQLQRLDLDPPRDL